MEDMTAYIYGLLDPDTLELRYVGLTRQDLKARLTKHLSTARQGRQAYVYRWIRSLSSSPVIVPLERTTDELVEEREVAWIARMREGGARLTNVTSGGQSGPTTPEHKTSISDALKGKPKSPEHKSALSESKRKSGWKPTFEHIRKSAEATSHLTPEKVMEIRERYPIEDVSQADLAREYEVSVSVINALVENRTWRHLPHCQYDAREKQLKMMRRGKAHHNAKLSEDQVASIRERYAAGGILQRELAEEYGVKQSTISGIVRRRRR